MVDPFSLAISIISLAVSSLTAWMTLFRRGTIKMTRPTTIYFGWDIPRSGWDTPPPKIYLRTLLFSSSKRGRIIESMHVRLSRNETHQNFSIWVFGAYEKLERGSGLFVGETGVAANHHFLTPKDVNSFRFEEGQYRLDVFAQLLGEAQPMKLLSQQLEVPREVASAIRGKTAGVYFDWGPDSLRYLLHVDKRPPPIDPKELLRSLGAFPPDEPPEG